MKGKIEIVSLCLLMALGVGCSGGEDPQPEDEIPMTDDQDSDEDGKTVSDEEANNEEASEEDPEEPVLSEESPIPANCTLDEVATGGEIRRSIIAGNILLAMVTYEIDAESGGFVSINGGNCSYDYAYFTETDTTLCHTNIPCTDWQFEYYVDFSNRDYPIWVLLAGDTRWVLGRFTGTLPSVTTAYAPSYPSRPTAPARPSSTYQAPAPSTPTPVDYGSDWEDAVSDAYRGGGAAAPYYPVDSLW